MVQMTDARAIETVRGGGRAKTPYSLHVAEDTTISGPCNHRWRTIACDDETDVIECSKCGAQRICACDFDDDFA